MKRLIFSVFTLMLFIGVSNAQQPDYWQRAAQGQWVAQAQRPDYFQRAAQGQWAAQPVRSDYFLQAARVQHSRAKPQQEFPQGRRVPRPQANDTDQSYDELDRLRYPNIDRSRVRSLQRAMEPRPSWKDGSILANTGEGIFDRHLERQDRQRMEADRRREYEAVEQRARNAYKEQMATRVTDEWNSGLYSRAMGPSVQICDRTPIAGGQMPRSNEGPRDTGRQQDARSCGSSESLSDWQERQREKHDRGID
jgi:hypothetical protein